MEQAFEHWIATQICDSSFGGSLSHSMGLESAFHLGILKMSSESIRDYLHQLLDQVSTLNLIY